ncbi:MAG TPA: methyltransferase domain-containing protein [Vicinamibacterales bacterium]|nr:methyltransferase domain-containing protein [Vicinamibacterales bacterium]
MIGLRRVRVARAALLLALAAGSSAQQRSPEDYAKLLEGAERVARMQVPRVVDALQLQPGMKVADLGSGSGLFTRPIAKGIAPGGIAYAVDIDRGLLQIVERSARDSGIDNIRSVLAGADDPRLPEQVDLVLICDTLHHIPDRGAYLQGLRKYVGPGGRVAVIDFSERWPEGHESMRYTAVQLESWMKDAGFVRIASHDWLENAFFLMYRAN